MICRLLKCRAAIIALLVLLQVLYSYSVKAQGNLSTVIGMVHGDNNQPLVNASVVIRNSQSNFTSGTKTDSSGRFTFRVPVGGLYSFTITNVGYEPQTLSGYNLKAGTTFTLDVSMKATAGTLEQVVVVGYGTQRKKDVTGSVASVNLEIMKNSPNTNMGQLLQGTVPGLNVGVSTVAGGTPPINIRGQVTLNGSKSVLIILDGIQYNGSLTSINPDDIASIDVLKDASSTAVYGAQAANGVILITSRKGRAGQKPRIAYSGSYSSQRPTVSLRPLNREEYLQRVTDAFWRQAYLGPDYTQPNPAFNLATKVDASMRDASGNLLPNDYDWWGNATNPGAITENNLSISGGTDNVNYLLSGSMVDQKNFIINDLFKRKTLRANLEIKPVKFWKVGLISSGSFVNQDGAEPTMSEIVRHAPLLVPFDSLGNLIPSPTNTVTFNPFRTYYVDDRERHQYFFANIYSDLDIPFIKGLNYRLNFGNNLRNDQHYFASKYDGGFTGRAFKDNRSYYDYTFDNILNYNTTFGNHSIGITALYGAIERNYERTFAEGVGFSRLNLSYNGIGGANTRAINPDNLRTANDPQPFAWKEALNYQMGRLNYKYNEKYLLTATLRRDGFSGFAENFKYALFPSVGLGWVISSEPFMQKLSAVNLLKLRTTYGSIGNQTGRYSSLAKVESNSSYVFGDGGSTAFGQQVVSLPNPDLKWERTQGLNLGVDFGLLDNRLNGTLEYYNNNTYDLLYSVTIPSITGFDKIQTNLGKIQNTGFEASLTYQIVSKKDFNWSATYNFWTNKNKIITLTGVDANGDGKEDDLVSDGLFIGKSIGTIFNYQAGPIYQLNETLMPGFQTGSFRVVDQNKDNDITPADRVFIGRTEPKFKMSLFNTMSYKGFTLSFLLNSIQGGNDGFLGNNTRVFFRDDNNIRDNDLNAVDYWSPRNPNGKYPRIVDGSRSKVEPNLYESRSFVRLQDLSLGYNLSAKVLQKIKAQAVNVFVSGKNLATWTKWEGWDPETGQGLDIGGRPVMRALSVGLQITY
jgi:TonB-dependent starch-binding outer membrane protein SusC